MDFIEPEQSAITTHINMTSDWEKVCRLDTMRGQALDHTSRVPLDLQHDGHVQGDVPSNRAEQRVVKEQECIQNGPPAGIDPKEMIDLRRDQIKRLFGPAPKMGVPAV